MIFSNRYVYACVEFFEISRKSLWNTFRLKKENTSKTILEVRKAWCNEMRWNECDHITILVQLCRVTFDRRVVLGHHRFVSTLCSSYLNRPMFLTRRRSNIRSRQLAARPQPSEAWWYLGTIPDMFKLNGGRSNHSINDTFKWLYD
jgi:hypothetical protein